MAKKVLKIVVHILVFLTVFTSFYFLFGYIASNIVLPGEKVQGERDIPIFIKTNGKHTDIVMPVKSGHIDWSKYIPYSDTKSNDSLCCWIAFGWGDKGFFIDMPTWDDLTFKLAFKATFWLSSTAMHATYYSEIYEDENCKGMMLSDHQYDRLINFIIKKFKTNPNGSFINIVTDATYGDNDAFYEAKGKYNLFYSCNTWVNDALRASGQRYCVWTFFDKPLFAINR